MRHQFVLAALLFGLQHAATPTSVQAFPLFETDTFDLRDPNYFITAFGSRQSRRESSLFAGKNNQAKFQININYKMAEWEDAHTSLYFGYTQRSFWNIYDPHAPFLDNNFRPSLFVYFDAASLERPIWLKPSLKLSLMHESNGLSGERQRGWNRVALATDLGAPSFNAFYASLSLWYVLNAAAREESYSRYLGDGELGLHWKLPLSLDRLRLGLSALMRFTYGAPVVTSVEIDAYVNPFRAARPNVRWLPTFMVQYFVGTGENLLNYRKRTASIRAGLAFLR